MLQAWHLPVAPFMQKRNRHLILSLWLAGDELPDAALLRYEQDNEEWLLPMQLLPEQSGLGCRRYRTEIPLDTGQPRRRYCFKLLWQEGQRWFTPLGWSAAPPGQMAQFAVDLPDNGPQWVADQVFYQIFTDRFAAGADLNGAYGRGISSDSRHPLPAEPGAARQAAAAADNHGHILPVTAASNRDPHQAAAAAGNRGPGQATAEMDNDFLPGEPSAGCAQGWGQNFEEDGSAGTFFGGDLHGVVAKLPWLTRLGVTALYFNPIFSAPSVHKYDTKDYRHVDERFGGDQALLRLRKATQRLRMRLILDGVFNHTGETHPWFDRDDAGGNGACHHPDSLHRQWYSFTPEGEALDWKGHASLPKLDYASSALVHEIYSGKDSVVRHWLRPPWQIDGWRLDVAHMLGESGGAKNNLHHINGITRAAKSVNPQSFIVGEHFGDARPWLQADAEDAAMNYRGFTLPVWAFLAGKDIAGHPISLTAQECARWLEEYRAGLSHQQQLRMFNQLDSHDTPRFITVLGSHGRRLALGVVWLFCWPGAPCIYYGDEVGLDGGNDPFCRKPFPWHEADQDQALLGLYRRLAWLRHDSPALRYGGCQVVIAREGLLVFVRVYQQERILVALQRGEGGQATLPWSPLLSGVAWQRLEGEGIQTSDGLVLPEDSVTLWRGKAGQRLRLAADPA